MLAVKIFQGSHTDVEKLLNEWFEHNEGIEVVNISSAVAQTTLAAQSGLVPSDLRIPMQPSNINIQVFVTTAVVILYEKGG